jgi:hypothetical protein
MIRLTIFFVCLWIGTTSSAQDSSIAIPVQSIGNKSIIIIGELGKPLGTPVTVKGIVVDCFSNNGKNGPNLIVQMVNDSATQGNIQIPIFDFNGTRAEEPFGHIEYGATYEFKVYETGDFIGRPYKIYQEQPFVKQPVPDSLDGSVVVTGYVPQGRGFHFQNKLIAKYGEKIKPIEWSPIQFTGRNAILTGIAKNEGDTAVIQNIAWKLKLIGYKKWTDAAIGKEAVVYGRIRQTSSKEIYAVETKWARLVKLEDQVCLTVQLRGRAISLNGNWWFNYLGTDIYVENMDKLPNWTVNNHYRAMEITGTLDLTELPMINQISLKYPCDKKLTYIVRNASWVPIDELFLPELKYDKYGIR